MFSRLASTFIVAVVVYSSNAAAVTLNMVSTIDGVQETPPNGSGGIGSGTFILDTDANTLSYSITFGGLGSAETASHIHGYSVPGVPSGVVHPLPLGSPKVGVWAYAEPEEGSIRAGLAYVNIHSVGFGGGEIRGQIIPTNDSTVAPRAGFKINIPTSQATVTKYVKLKVTNADPKADTFPDTLKLTPGAGCTGLTVGTPDFDPSTPASEDSVALAGTKSKSAKIALTADSSLISTANPKAPFRCAVDFTTSTEVTGGNQDPTPENNTFTLTIDIIDKHDLP